MKHVVLDARMLQSAGIGTYLQNIIPSLKSDLFKLSLIVKKRFLKDFPYLENFDLIFLEDSIYSIKEQCTLLWKIPKCDLFWAPHFNIPLLPISAKRRLVTIHDVFHLAHLSSLKFHERLYAKIVIEAAVKISDCIITDSKFSKTEILRLTSAKENKIRVISLGVNRDVFTSNSKNINQTLPENFFLFVGNVKKHKNIEGLLKAFTLLQKDIQCDLIILGKQTELKNSFSIPTLKRVHFLENVSTADLPNYFKQATALVFPSFYEGFGLPPLEAMSVGCPVIASNAASIPEVCGDAVLYIDPYNIIDIKEKMKTLLLNDNIRREFIKKGFSQVEKFSWRSTIQKHFQVIEALIR